MSCLVGIAELFCNTYKCTNVVINDNIVKLNTYTVRYL